MIITPVCKKIRNSFLTWSKSFHVSTGALTANTLLVGILRDLSITQGGGKISYARIMGK